MKTFKEKVIEIVKNIPKGEILTYKMVAKKAGNINAARVVGNIMSKNHDKSVPCHRVIKSDGSTGNYNEFLGKTKRALLEEEKVFFDKNNRVIK